MNSNLNNQRDRPHVVPHKSWLRDYCPLRLLVVVACLSTLSLPGATREGEGNPSGDPGSAAPPDTQSTVARKVIQRHPFPWKNPAPVVAAVFPGSGNLGAGLTSSGVIHIYVPGEDLARVLPWKYKVSVLIEGPSANNVIFGDVMGNVVSFDLRKRTPLWRVPLSRSPVVSIVPASGRRPEIVAATQDAFIASIDAITGRTRKAWTTPQTIVGLAAPAAPGEPVILTQAAGARVLPDDEQPFPMAVWPPDDSMKSQSVLVAAFDPKGTLAVVDAGQSLHLFFPDEKPPSGYADAKVVPLDTPPSQIALLPDGRFLLGSPNGSLWVLEDTSVQAFAPAPMRQDRLLHMLVLEDGSVARLFASNHVDIAHPDSEVPHTESIALTAVADFLVRGPAANQILAIGQSLRPILLQIPSSSPAH